MILGEYAHSLDAKNRITLPAKLRETLGENIVMVKSVDRCVAIYNSGSWSAFTAKLDLLPDIETRRVRRFIYASAFETAVDGQGRILIAQNLCEYAALVKNVIIIGAGDHAEIWSDELWAAETGAENAAEIADTLIKLGF